jgi:hydroxymethylpyrimidine kinase/phosphomethylpyrimidine kinase/thiamine-phosphate diphosphorylase
MKQVIVWTIAGSDSSGCAGVQADIKTFNTLGVHGCSIITAVTAQTPAQLGEIQFVSITSQFNILQSDLPSAAIKIGMLGSLPLIDEVHLFLNHYMGKVILDPVMITTSGGNLYASELQQYISQLKKLFPYVDLLTPNLPEAEIILGRKINSYKEMEEGARDICLLGAKSVLIKGGHFDQDIFSQDFWTNGTESFWLISPRLLQKNYSGTGCTLSSAIAAAYALEYSLKDAIVIGKMFINQAMRLSTNNRLIYAGWPENNNDLPCVSNKPLRKLPTAFPDCGSSPLGLYPIVDSIEWVKKLLPLGIKTLQLRIKNHSNIELAKHIQQAVMLAKQYNARLFINDYWELAIRYGAYGVHLGQEDLSDAAVYTILAAGLRLGISTHCYYEVARAHAFHPSYIACGPIFSTTSKKMLFDPQGLENLKRWRATLKYPIVAIGGITLEKLPSILATKVDGFALIAAITRASDPIAATENLLAMVN